jgi:hypothetical protein
MKTTKKKKKLCKKKWKLLLHDLYDGFPKMATINLQYLLKNQLAKTQIGKKS